MLQQLPLLQQLLLLAHPLLGPAHPLLQQLLLAHLPLGPAHPMILVVMCPLTSILLFIMSTQAFVLHLVSAYLIWLEGAGRQMPANYFEGF
jgi:hypothetical protein